MRKWFEDIPTEVKVIAFCVVSLLTITCLSMVSTRNNDTAVNAPLQIRIVEIAQHTYVIIGDDGRAITHAASCTNHVCK